MIHLEIRINDFGEVHCCLGLWVIRNRANRTIHLSQQSYLEYILKRFNMQNCKPSITPMEANVELSKKYVPSNIWREDIHGQHSILKSGRMFGILCHDLYLAQYCLYSWYCKPILRGPECQMNDEVPTWYRYSWNTLWSKHKWRH